MHFGGKQIDVKSKEIRDKTENPSTNDNKSENASEMDCNESPRSSTSMELAEFSIPLQSNEDSGGSSDEQEEEVNLPAGVCVCVFSYNFKTVTFF